MTFYDGLVHRLAASGVDYCIHEHAPSVTVVHAETYLDFPVERLLKTIAFRIKQGDWVLAALCGHNQVDYKKLAAVCGVSRDKLMRLTPEAVEQELGFEIGGVSPLARQPNLRVIIDAGALQYEHVFCGTGRKDRTLEIGPADLVALTGATVAELAKG